MCFKSICIGSILSSIFSCIASWIDKQLFAELNSNLWNVFEDNGRQHLILEQQEANSAMDGEFIQQHSPSFHSHLDHLPLISITNIKILALSRRSEAKFQTPTKAQNGILGSFSGPNGHFLCQSHTFYVPRVIFKNNFLRYPPFN